MKDWKYFGKSILDILESPRMGFGSISYRHFRRCECGFKWRISDQTFKKFSTPDLNCSRNFSSITVSLRTGHFRGMEISPDDNSRYYAFCRNIPDTQLTPDYIFDCQSIIVCLFQLDEPPQGILYSPSGSKPGVPHLQRFWLYQVFTYLWRQQQENLV